MRESRKTARELPASEWQRARDLVASGMRLREVGRRIGISEATIRSRAKREGWYRPDKQAASMPPPPPPKPPKPPLPGGDQVGGGRPPPNPSEYAEDLAYYRSLIRWATEGLATLARFTPNVQMWLVEKLPSAIKALSLADVGKQAAPPGDLLAEVEARLRKINRPPSRPADRGESPEDREDGGQ